jgi:hypothetical protein
MDQNQNLRDSLTDAVAHIDRAKVHVGGDFSDTIATGHALRVAVEHLHNARDCWVAQAIAEGASWRQIGDCLGVTRSAVQQRYAHLVRE